MAAATALLIADRAIHQQTAFEKTGVYLASFSYSLYAIHWPVMLGLLAAVQTWGFLPERLPPGIFAYAMIGSLVLFAYGASTLFAWLTEQRTDNLRRRLANLRPSSNTPNPDRHFAVTPPPPS